MSSHTPISVVVRQVVHGHVNKALDKVGMLPADTKQMSEERFAHCELCAVTPSPINPNENGPGLRHNKYCISCGCDMEAKTTIVDAKCPIGRWL